MAVSFVLGETFSSYDDVERKIADYERTQYSKLVRRDSRTINAAVNKKSISVDKVTNENKEKLKYYELLYTCIHGGRKRKSCSKGIRQSSTFQKDCPFRISLRLSNDGTKLVVCSITNEHVNHEVSEENFQYYPKVGKLSDDQRLYAENMLLMNANKKKLQQQLANDTGKSVLLRDLSNIANAARRRNNTTRNDLSKCAEELRNVHNCKVDICTNQENDFCGLFIQDKRMRDTFSAFPEIIFLDATYKLLDLQFPVYVFACEDSNGATEIVGLGMLVTEDAPSVRWLIETFQKYNPEISNTRLVMADKDINERDVIKEILPHIKVLICLFHTLRTFKREVNIEDMNINKGQKIACLEYISKMAYSKSESEYNSIHLQFLNAAPTSVKTYFENNWHPIRDEWVMGPKFSTGNFLNATNNRLESLNGKLKQVVTKYSSLENFIREFFIILSVLRNERSYQAIYSCQKDKVLPHPPNSPEAAYVNFLTSYASNFVLNQIEISNKVTYQWVNGNAGTFTLQSSQGVIEVCHTRCSCLFYKSMRLPCRHIFSLRKKDGVSLFDRSLCDTRWTMAYFRSKSTAFRNPEREYAVEDAGNSMSIDTLSSTRGKRMNSHQKFAIALNSCKKIANTISMFSDNDFNRKLAQLKELNEIWTLNKEVGFQTFENLTSTPPDNVNCDNGRLDQGLISAELNGDDEIIGQGLISNNINNDDNEIFDQGLISSLTSAIEDNEYVEDSSPTINSAIIYEDKESELNPQPEVRGWLTTLIDKIVDQEVNIDFRAEKGKANTLTITKLDIKMPPAIKRKGRPKGSDKTTAIGLPKKKISGKGKDKPVRFIDMSNSEREKLTLMWCLGSDKALECLSKGAKINVVDVDPTEITAAIFNELVCVKTIQYLFDSEAWDKFTLFYTEKMERLKFQCNSCLEVCQTSDDLISCDHCLRKYHYVCAKCKKGSKKRNQWFCNQCKNEAKCNNVTKSDGLEESNNLD